ncbi:MAG TPA: HWE histidine kinase domain-containing protein [Steroidobacteraceae bacterium]
MTSPIEGAALQALALEAVLDFAIISLNPDATVTNWNAGAERLLGYGRKEMLNRSADVIFTPEDRAAGVPERERALALSQARAEDERWHMRKDGSRFWGSGLMMRLPPGTGFLKIMRDQTERHLAQKRIEVSEACFRTLATNIPQVVFASRVDGVRSWAGPQWIIFTGCSERDSLAYGWLDAIDPEDREATRLAWVRAREVGEYYIEHRVWKQATSQYRWHQTRATPLDPADPDQSEWVGTSTDIHELRTLQENQQILLAELQHRTRNLLAMVQSIARRGARDTDSFSEFLDDFEGRMRALSRVQSLLPISDAGAVPIDKLVRQELAAHVSGAEEPGRLTVTGIEAGISAASAQILALALHELVTNAVKYGALRQERGHLHIAWTVTPRPDRSGSMLSLTWRETGVPMPQATPRRRGYGTELLTRALPYQLGANTQLEFTANGVSCSIDLPIANSRSQAT